MKWFKSKEKEPVMVVVNEQAWCDTYTITFFMKNGLELTHEICDLKSEDYYEDNYVKDFESGRSGIYAKDGLSNILAWTIGDFFTLIDFLNVKTFEVLPKAAYRVSDIDRAEVKEIDSERVIIAKLVPESTLL